MGVYNIFKLHSISGGLTHVTYYTYWFFIIPPMVYMLMVLAFSPKNEEKDLEKVFNDGTVRTFGLLALYQACHLFNMYEYDPRYLYARLLVIAGALAFAFTKRIAFFYALIGLWILSLFVR